MAAADPGPWRHGERADRDPRSRSAGPIPGEIRYGERRGRLVRAMRLADDDENAPGQIAKITFNAKATEAAEKNQGNSAITQRALRLKPRGVSRSRCQPLRPTEITEKSPMFWLGALGGWCARR